MRYDPDSLSLRFDDAAEFDRFHADLGELVRRVVLQGASAQEDPATGVERARAAMTSCGSVIQALNAIRGRLRDDGR